MARLGRFSDGGAVDPALRIVPGLGGDEERDVPPTGTGTGNGDEGRSKRQGGTLPLAGMVTATWEGKQTLCLPVTIGALLTLLGGEPLDSVERFRHQRSLAQTRYGLLRAKGGVTPSLHDPVFRCRRAASGPLPTAGVLDGNDIVPEGDFLVRLAGLADAARERPSVRRQQVFLLILPRDDPEGVPEFGAPPRRLLSEPTPLGYGENPV